jgi:RTA1 like protein
LKAALCLQLGVLCCFVLLAASFHWKCKKAKILPANLRAALITLYISSALIGVRTIYRTVEYFRTSSLNFSDPNLALSSITPMMRYEWFFWVFEASLMVINSCMLNARHPMRHLPRNNKIYLAEDGETEILGPGYEDKRSFLVTFLDPFDLLGMWKGNSLGKRFWETHAEGRVVAGELIVDDSRDQAGEAEKARAGRRQGLMAFAREKK